MRVKAMHLRFADLYASVIAVECTTSTRDDKAAKPQLIRTRAMHLRSPISMHLS
jgi:hypothetical protein